MAGGTDSVTWFGNPATWAALIAGLAKLGMDLGQWTQVG